MEKAKAMALTAKHARTTVQEMAKSMDLRYKIVAGLLAAGVSGLSIYYYLSGNDAGDDGEEDENSDINDNYFVRRIVKKWWIPMMNSKLNRWFGSFKTTTETEAELEKKRISLITERWRYPENDGEASFDLNAVELTADELQMPEDLLFLFRNTHLLGEIDKEKILSIWKHVEILNAKPGKYLFQIGEPDDSVYIIIEGSVDVFFVDESLNLTGFHEHEEDCDHLTINYAFPGQAIVPIYSFIDILTEHEAPLKTVQAVAVADTTYFKLPMKVFKAYWYKHPHLLHRALRRFIRRIYQGILGALHAVLGLSMELLKRNPRLPPDPDFDNGTSLVPTEEERLDALKGAMKYFELEGDDIFEIFKECVVIILAKDTSPIRPGQVAKDFLYMHKGELEVQQTIASKKTKEEVSETLFQVSAGEAVGGLTLFANDIVNIFTGHVSQRALCVLISPEILDKLLKKNPFVVRIIAHAIVCRHSNFSRALDFGLDWMFIESGHTVYRAGDPPRDTYLVLSGRLRSIFTNSKGKNTVKGDYGRNDWVGLVETLTGKYRSKTVIAVRDTELARIPGGLLNLIKLKFPIVAMRLLDFLGKRVAKSYESKSDKRKRDRGRTSSTVALIPVNRSIPVYVFAHCLKETFELYGDLRSDSGVKVMTRAEIVATLGEDSLDEGNDFHLTGHLASLEDHAGLIIFVAESAPNDSWTRKCIKQADVILILVDGADKRTTQLTPIEKRVNLLAPRAKKELVLLHTTEEGNEDGAVYPILTRLWLNKRRWITFHHHIAISSEAWKYTNKSYEDISKEFTLSYELHKMSDFARLCRWLSRTSVGVVLGGGGAKGAAHIGVIRVLTELDIPIDYIAGVSIGSFVGGLFAMTQDIDVVEKMAGDWFDKISKSYQYLLDITIPHVSLFKGEAFNNSIKACFGDTQIEDLRIPYFTVSTDMTANRSRVHKSGPLWRYARASMTLSGYFPPICDLDGHFLMDGGYTNLVPANVMRSFGAGWILGVDVSNQDPIETTNYGDHLSGMRALLPHLIPYVEPFKIPNFLALQQQLSFVQSALYMEIIKEMDKSSIYIRPPLDFHTTADFPEFRKIMDVGYVYTQQIFRRCSKTDPIEVIWSKIAQDLQTFQEDIYGNRGNVSPTRSEKNLEMEQGSYEKRRTQSFSGGLKGSAATLKKH